MNRIYTVGHSNHEIEYFLELLGKYNIDCVIDIRSVPYSKYVPQYNKNTIKRILQSKGIYCIYMGEELGILQEDKEFLSKAGYLDFEKMRKSTQFTEAIKRIEDGMNKDYTIAIMCTEKDPIDCHRSILIARELVERNHELRHIMPDGSLETQAQLEERLINLYFKDSLQESLFHIVSSADLHQENINRAYLERNKDLVKKL